MTSLISARSPVSLMLRLCSTTKSFRMTSRRESKTGNATCQANVSGVSAAASVHVSQHLYCSLVHTCATCNKQPCGPWLPSPRLLSTYSFLKQTCAKVLAVLAGLKFNCLGLTNALRIRAA